MSNQPPQSNDSSESILALAQRLKRADRQRLLALPPDQAQTEAEQILDPDVWSVADSQELPWPGDLAGPPGEPDWMTGQ